MRAALYSAAVMLLAAGGGMPALASQAEPPSSWVAEVQQRVQAKEYEVSWHDGYQAPNRKHGFRTFFTEQGIRAVPRVETDATWEWGLRWIGYGRGTVAAPVPEAGLSPRGNRIDYRRGPFTEWYENGPKGLKQGFVLPAPPQDFSGGPPSPEPVHVDLALSGSLSPVISEDGQVIDFVTGDGTRVLRYAELRVTDASGREVPSWMEGFVEADVRGIRLVFDARDAVYPLTIDPLTSTPVWSAESNQAIAEFGKSVGTAGDVNGDGFSDVIVGAPFYDNGQTDEGRAYLFLGSASGLSSTPAWTVEGDQAGARFGWSVATAGDINGDGFSDVIVGAPLYDGGSTDEGRAYVYKGLRQGLSTTATWIKEIDQGGAQFGTSVAPAGDVNGDGYADVIVGAPLYDGGLTDEGAALVFLGSASGPATTAVRTFEGNQAGAQFGLSVATAGDVDGDGFSEVLVGAPLYDDGETDEGRAYLYDGSASGPSAHPTWSAQGDQAGADFGHSVATAGDVNGDGHADVMVGARFFTTAQSLEGQAYLYLGSASGLAPTPAWLATSVVAQSYFGWSVGSAGDVNGDGYGDVIISAPFYYVSTTEGGGKAWVFLGSPSGLSFPATWSDMRSLANAAFGSSVATAGDVNGDGYADVLVGAPWDDDGQTNEGLAYVYLGSASALGSTPDWIETGVADAWTGAALSTAGDVNGDGYADLLIGAPLYDNGEGDEGKAFLFVGSASGLTATAWSPEGNQAYAHFGDALSTAGDVNGDGYDDVIVGAPLYDGTAGVDTGKAFVYLGSPSGLSSTPAWTKEGDGTRFRLGYALGTAGDVNGDGYADVIVGVPAELTIEHAIVYLGSPSGLAATAAWTATIALADFDFGSAVGTAGDVNGDGYADVVVGAPGYSDGETSEGGTFVYLGSPGGLATGPAWIAEGNQPGAAFGSAVGTAGDVNGDGYADLIVAAVLYDGGSSDDGRAFVYLGSAVGLATSAAWTMDTGEFRARLGAAATAGDVNGDGYGDVVLGSFHFSSSQGLGYVGKAWLFLGSATGLQTTPAWTAEGDQDDGRFGSVVSTAGDVNGDGYADVVIGEPHYNDSQPGQAYLWFGNDGGGIAARPRQRTNDNTRPIARLGLSDSGFGFRLAALGRTPFGRGRVQLAWQVRPFGTPLPGSTTTGTPVDTGVLGVSLLEPVAALTPATRYHWRVRLLYDQATTPFAKGSRWFTIPWGGWNLGMLRTPAVPAGRAAGLVLAKAGADVTAMWGTDSCLGGSSHAIYEGTLGNFTSHVPVTCSTGTGSSWTFTPLPGNRYFLVVPVNSAREGSYGLDGSGGERPASPVACKPQMVATCP